MSYLSPKRQNLPAESWKHVGFAILFLIQDSGWAIPIWEAGHTLQGGTAVSLKLHSSGEEFSLWVMRRGTALNSLATADSEQNPVRSCRGSSVSSQQGWAGARIRPRGCFWWGMALYWSMLGAGNDSRASQEVPLVLLEMTQQAPACTGCCSCSLAGGAAWERGSLLCPLMASLWPRCHGKLRYNEAIAMYRNQILLSQVLTPADTSECGMNTVSSFWSEGFSSSNWDQSPDTRRSVSWGLQLFFLWNSLIWLLFPFITKVLYFLVF